MVDYSQYTMIIEPNAPIDTILRSISEHLAVKVRQAGLKKKDLARLADVNPNTITAVLSGGDTRLSTLIRISRVLGDIEWLMPLLKKPEPSPLEQLKTTTHKAKVSPRKPDARKMGRKGSEG